MANPFLAGYRSGSFHIKDDLRGLRDMIKAFSLKLSVAARERLAWMDEYRLCQNAALVCRKFGVSECTFWRWRKRYDPWDLISLESRSRKPRRSPKKTPITTERMVLNLKRAHPRWGKEKLAFLLRQQGVLISGKTVWKILDRHRLNIRYHTRKRKAPKPRVNRALIHVPGDLAQVDTKFISLHGRRLYQYTFIDVISRWRHAEIHPSSDMATTITFLQGALKASHTTFSVLQTDNGHEFGRSVSAWLRKHNIRHVFSHKGRPVENAYVERSHRIDEEEFYSTGGNGSTIKELRENFANYISMYNTERPHWGLQGQTPMQFLNDYLTKQPCQMS